MKIEEKKFNNRISIIERTSPTTAMARGFLNKPTKENAKPINQMINQVKVFQKKTLVNRARIKPVIPMPFKRCAFFMIFGELPVKTIFSLVQKISIEQAYNCRKCQICITAR